MDDVELIWQDREGPYKDRDVISRSEYELPVPYGRAGDTIVLVVISSDQREEGNQTHA